MTCTVTESDLAQFYGTEDWHRNPLFPGVVYTDGVQYLGSHGAGWLVDLVSMYQRDPKVKKNRSLQEIQFWTLKVNLQNHTAVLVCQADSGRPNVIEHHIEYTDYPFAELKLYVEPMYDAKGSMCILLPSEH
jgi:hypothetical protein